MRALVIVYSNCSTQLIINYFPNVEDNIYIYKKIIDYQLYNMFLGKQKLLRGTPGDTIELLSVPHSDLKR